MDGNIRDLRELNRMINNAANVIVKRACEATEDGRHEASLSDVAEESGEGLEELRFFGSFLESELMLRPEILKATVDSDRVALLCDGRYCSGYKWQEDSQELMGISQETWQLSTVRPVGRPLDLTRMAEIGEGALRVLLEKNTESAELLLKETCQATAEELTALGLDAEKILGTERREIPDSRQDEIEGDERAILNEQRAWFEENMQKEFLYRRNASKFIDESESGEAEALGEETKSGSEQVVIPQEMIDEARDASLLEMLERDHQYRAYCAENSELTEKYAEAYRILAKWQLPKRGKRYAIRSDSNSSNRGRECEVLGETILGGKYAYKVTFDFYSKEEGKERQPQDTVKCEDLIPSRINELVVGRWKVKLIAPGDIFGEEELIVNNGGALIEFLDIFPGFLPQGVSVEERAGKPGAKGFMAPFWRGRFTGARYLVSAITESYKISGPYEGGGVQHGLCFQSRNGESRAVTAAEMDRILYWLTRVPIRNTPTEVQGEVEIPSEKLRESEEIAAYVMKGLSEVYGAADIEILSSSRSEDSTSVEFNFVTLLNGSGLRAVMQTIFDGCEVNVRVLPRGRIRNEDRK